MKPRKTKKRAPPLGSPEGIAEYNRWHAQFQRNMVRKIRAWARTWERCPLAGCRRSGRCRRFDACRGVSDEPPTPEQLALIRAAIAEWKGPEAAKAAGQHRERDSARRPRGLHEGGKQYSPSFGNAGASE